MRAVSRSASDVAFTDRRYWYLITQFAFKDFKIRYSHSALGYVWSVINPLLFCGLYYLVFSVFIRFEVLNYPGYLLLGIVLWNFFSEGSAHGATSLLARGGILTKVAMPAQLVVYAAVLNAFLTFAINLLVLGFVLWLTGTPLRWPMATFPIAVLDLVLFTLGVSLLLAPLHVRYHDVGHLWGILLQVGFWLTPIIYEETIVPSSWRWLVSYNPMARIIAHGREALVWTTWTSADVMAGTTAFAAGMFVVGWTVFRRLRPRLVEYF
jgi:ABC-type polysaccharide/polyol phosphate export permease